MRTPEQHPWTHKSLAFFDSLDFPTLYPEKWAKQLAVCEGDVDAARKMAGAMLAHVHSPIHGPITREKHDSLQDFRVRFGITYLWDHRRFLRHTRKSLGGNRKARHYWRMLTKEVRRA